MTTRTTVPNAFLSQVVGIDRIIGLAEMVVGRAAEQTYPPYNLVKVGDNGYKIELAVAGFDIEELQIETKERVLYISGEHKEAEVVDADTSAEKPTATFLHRGIANRAFKREFQLADFVEVKGASLKNGILSIALVREVPEAQKHRKINIGEAAA